MPLEGTLNDVSLSSLIQIFCLERKQISLTLKRLRETGLIYFSQGDIIHAIAGTETGPPALYYLLTWPDGNFQTSLISELPPRTITQRWDGLLLEGMRLLDEQQHYAPLSETSLPLALTNPERNQEEAIADKLLELMSRLEQFTRRLEHLRVRNNPPEALEILTRIVNQMLVTFHQVMAQLPLSQAVRQSMIQVLSPHLAKMPLSEEGRFIAGAGILREYETSSVWQKPKTFVQLVERLTDVLAYAYFAILASCFRSADTKAKWTEAYNIFLGDLQEQLARINS